MENNKDDLNPERKSLWENHGYFVNPARQQIPDHEVSSAYKRIVAGNNYVSTSDKVTIVEIDPASHKFELPTTNKEAIELHSDEKIEIWDGEGDVVKKAPAQKTNPWGAPAKLPPLPKAAGTYISKTAVKTLKKPNDIVMILSGGDGNEILRFENNGDIYVRGEFAQNDYQIIDGFRQFLRYAKYMP